jgi:hypothetical protein
VNTVECALTVTALTEESSMPDLGAVYPRKSDNCVRAVVRGNNSLGRNMDNLNLVDAFARYGGKPANRLHSLSAMAADGAMILGCSSTRFRHPAPGVLRYEDTLSRDPSRTAECAALGAHLSLARDGKLPVRMIVIANKVREEGAESSRSIHIRSDLIGSVVEFDGDHYIVDFVRAGAPAAEKRIR